MPTVNVTPRQEITFKVDYFKMFNFLRLDKSIIMYCQCLLKLLYQYAHKMNKYHKTVDCSFQNNVFQV